MMDCLQGWCGGRDMIRDFWMIHDFWTRIALVCWYAWLHRNDVVFEGATPSPALVLSKISVETEWWRVANLFRTSLALVNRWRELQSLLHFSQD
jgi:hypothetical protein